MSSLYERRLLRSRLLSKSTILLALRFFWVIVVIWCEFGIFFYSLSDCRWPDKDFRSSARSPSRTTPTHVLLVTDAQLRNPSKPGSWFRYDANLSYLRRSWRVASRLHPDVVMFLGDTFASARYITSEAEYEKYYRTFQTTFPRGASVEHYLIPGNNDIGLGDSSSLSKDARRFFEKYLGPLNRVASVAGHQFVLLNAPGLVDEDYRRHAHGKTYDHWTPLPGGPIEFVKSISNQEGNRAVEPKILLTHIPLSRPSSKSCGPLREKATIQTGAGHGYQTMLGKQTTEFLLETLRPVMVFSGDNRDYCEITHELPDSVDTVREVTVKSFSPSRHIRRPGFQLLSLVPPSSPHAGLTIADTPCLLPDTLRVFHWIYVPCLALTVIVLLYVNITTPRYRTHLFNISPIYGRPSPSPEPESAIWATRTPLKSGIQTSPTAPLPLSARTKSVPFSPSSTPQGSPLLSPITLFPSGDQHNVEEEYVGPSHYTLRRDSLHNGGWQGEHDDDVARERDAATLHPPAHRHRRAATAPYFLPPPLSQHARSRWSFTWSFTLRGRRRRMVIGVPDWKSWWDWLNGTPGLSIGRTGRERGLAWRFASDSVSVALPAVVAWSVIGWLFF